MGHEPVVPRRTASAGSGCLRREPEICPNMVKRLIWHGLQSQPELQRRSGGGCSGTRSLHCSNQAFPGDLFSEENNLIHWSAITLFCYYTVLQIWGNCCSLSSLYFIQMYSSEISHFLLLCRYWFSHWCLFGCAAVVSVTLAVVQWNLYALFPCDWIFRLTQKF